MAIQRTQIIGTVLDPAGVPLLGGTIEFNLSVGTGTTPDDTTAEVYVVGGEETAIIGQDGTVSFYLVPNDTITPAGSIWIATFRFPGGQRFRENWTITSASPVQIGDIARSNAGSIAGSRCFLIVAAFSALPTPAASIQGCIGYVQGIADEQDQEYTCMKGWDNLWRWVPSTEGGGP